MNPTSPTVTDPYARSNATAESDVTIDRTRWEPTASQLASYKAREVQLCVAAMEREKPLIQSNTLFTPATWEAAKRFLKGLERQAA